MLDRTDDQALAAVEAWLAALERGIAAGDLAGLFLEESWWRDAVALTWGLETVEGGAAAAAALAPSLARAGAREFRLDPAMPAPQAVTRVGTEVIEAFLRFETETGRCRGVVRLAPGSDGRPAAWTFLTELDQIRGHEERIGAHRPTGQSHSRDFRGPNWADQRRAALAYEDRDPTVLIVGGGQAGLAIAARLGQLGIDALIVDRNARIGDNWRLRYHALTLHNQVQVNHMPYMPFPPNWPTYIPKDKLANWFEAYVEAMELNFWTSTEVTGGDWDADAGRWTILLAREGREVVLRPRHVVMATGVSGIPNIPEIAGLDAFGGQVLHSSAYSDGEDFSGKRAIVIGTGNSGHDIAQDLWSSGAEVTLVQRSPTLVVNIEPSAQLPYSLYDSGPSLEECDLIVVSTPVPLVRRAHRDYTRQAREIDRPLLDGLEARGFRLDFGEDGTGWQFKYLTRGGGYYFNVGCSDLIAEGKVRLEQFSRITGFEAGGAVLEGGERLPADLIVLSTGYKGQEVLVERLFGAEVAGRVGPIWGFGDGHEIRNMYCRTGQPGLWFIAGSLAQCRINSKYMAQQIKAIEEGLIPAEV